MGLGGRSYLLRKLAWIRLYWKWVLKTEWNLDMPWGRKGFFKQMSKGPAAGELELPRK